jgi:ABC-type Fe3+-siderophore transport system permease subunit
MFADRIVSRLKGEDGAERYRSYSKLKTRLIILFAAVAVAMAFLSIGIGKYDVDLVRGLEIIYDYFSYGPSDSIEERVVFTQRIPRGLMAVIVGLGLAIAGAVMQSMLHNPLADPYTTGVSSGASMGASLFVVLGVSIIPISGSLGLMTNAFVFSLIPAFLILGLSVFKKITSTTMILIGIGVMYMFSALTQMLKVMATPQQMERLYLWQLGSLGECSLSDVVVVSVVVLVCAVVLYGYRVDLNLLSVGDKPALTMGTDPWKTRIICLVIVSFMTAVAVSFTGVIGFVGLVAPQMVRTLIGSDNRFLLPASAAFGGMFLVICDCLCRVLGSTGVPVGVLTAVIGSPLFLYMLIKRSKKPTI